KTDERRWAVINEIEGRRGEVRWREETQKHWDPIHRCLTDGELDCGSTPLHRVIFADRNLCDDDDERYISLVTPKRVQAVAAAIRGIDKAWMRERYFAIDPEDYDVALDEEDFDLTWEWFVLLRKFFERAAGAERWVTFTVTH